MSRPKLEFVPKTLADLHVDSGLSDHMNGGNFSLHGKTHFTNTPHTARRHSGGLAVSNCSLFSLYFCYAGVYVSLRGSTLIDIHIASVSYIPLPSAKPYQIFSMLCSHKFYYLRLSKLIGTIRLILPFEILSRLFLSDMNEKLYSYNIFWIEYLNLSGNFNWTVNLMWANVNKKKREILIFSTIIDIFHQNEWRD